MASNNYVAQYIPSDLPWYERDGLMMWHDQRKCKDFFRAPKNHFKNRKIVNFDIIRKQAAGEKVPNETKKVPDGKRGGPQNIPKKTRRIFSHAFKTERPDIHFERNVIRNHFKCK